MSLDSHLTISHLELLAKTEKADLDRETIIGQFAKIPLVIHSPARACEEFANCPGTPSQILRFTRKYGPLMSSAEPGGTFRFELQEWCAYHKFFCSGWEALAKSLGIVAPEERNEKYWNFPKGSRLVFSRNGNVLQQERFFDLINLCFGALPWERIRMCPAPGCEKPFFVATHLNQAYCGDQVCIEWGKRKLKLEYWNRNKGRFLAERKRNR